MSGLNTPLKVSIAKYAPKILHGNILAIDPSSTSLGYAISHKGVFVEGGERKFKGDISTRLHEIFMEVFKLHQEADADLLIIERLRSVPPNGKGFSNYTPVQLLWSVGVLLAAAPIPFIEMSPASWKVWAREEGLAKTDANDARAILGRAIQLAGDYK
jgi:hypothetical protein